MERMKRWLSLALVLVLVLSFVAVNAFAAGSGETVTVCFVPSKDWKQDNCWFAAYCWNDSGSQWVRLTQAGFYYTGEIPVEYTNIIFARMASNQTEMNWDNRWTQTGDQVLEASNPCFVKGSGWEGSGGTWTTCPPAFDYYLAGYLNGSDVGINNVQNKAEYLFTNGYLDVTFTSDSYLCMSVQYDGVVIGNLMTASYVSSGDSALMQITGNQKFRLAAGTYRLVMTRHEDDSVTLGIGCLHDKTYHTGVEATCTDSGLKEYWSCDICGKNYADEYGVTELTDLTIPAKNHNYSDNGFCTNVNGGLLCDAYEPAIPVIDENYAELGLTSNYVGYYAITNAGNLYWFADKVDNENDTYKTAKVVLTKDITVNSGTVTAESTGLRVWNPIGYYNCEEIEDGDGFHEIIDDRRFNGTFEGNGKTVSGLYFNDENASYVGLLARTTENTLVKDVTLSNSYICGNNMVGGIVGYCSGGTVTGCVNQAAIYGNTNIGGIVGEFYHGTVIDCVNNAVICGSGAHIGGIAGAVYSAKVEQCVNTGNVTGTGTVAGTGQTGGIVGHAVGDIQDCQNSGTITSGMCAGGITGSGGTIENCGNSGTVTGQKAGGICGDEGDVTNCWNTGTIHGTVYAGGIEGCMEFRWTSKKIENCWSTGTVTCDESDTVGGIIGYSKCTGQTVKNSYSVMEPVGEISDEYGTPTVTDVEIKTLAQFTSGEVAYLLRTRVAEGTNVWGQDLDNGKTVQTVPTFTGADVYKGYTSCADTEHKYTNDPNVSATPIPHDWEYTADGASITGECLNGCGVDGGKVTLVLDGSTVYDGTEKVVVAEGSLTGIATLPAVTYEGNRVNIGTFTAFLTLEDGTQAKLDVTITAKELTPTVEGLEDSYEYTGEAIKPVVTVKDGDKVLTEGTDYDMTYGENLNVGEGSVTVTLKGDYEGQLKQTFGITPKKITPAIEGVKDSYTYTGSQIKPEITIKDGGKVLTEGTDYTVTYGENKNVGEGTVTVTLKGNYEGEGKKTFTIAPKEIAPTIEGVKSSYTVTGEQIKPAVTVKDGDKVFVEGTDYEVTYGKNTDVGTGTVTVTMKGNYAGEAKVTFTIAPVPDSPATGDTANVALWSGIMLISLAAAAALVLGKKRFTV